MKRHAACTILWAVLLAVLPPTGWARAMRIDARIDGGSWRTVDAVSVRRDQSVRLRVPADPDAEIRWYRIIPDASVRYHNAGWPWMPDAYQWKGFDTIRYFREELTRFRNSREINPFLETDTRGLTARLRDFFFSPEAAADGTEALPLGSYWYQAELIKPGGTDSSPGLEGNDARGLSPRVFRISVRQSDDLLGHLTTYFNVPAVFGSVPYQVRHYIGIDCADVLMAAYALWKRKPVEKDYNVAMLTRKFPLKARCRIVEGVPDTIVHWNTVIRPGDFIAVRYDGARQFQHIGALYADKGRAGVLDEADIILHAGPDPLQFSPLASGVFDGEVVILRP